MRRPRWQTLLSLGLIVCMTFSLMPLGCSSVKLNHYPHQEDLPRIPEATEKNLKECVEELKDGINAGFYYVDAKVTVDKNGDVVGLEAKGEPNPDVGRCMRIALRGMRVPEEVLERGVLRRSAAADGQVMPDPAQMGEVVTIVVVTIVFTEIVIDAFAIAVGVTVTATLTAGAAAAIAKRKKRRSCEKHYALCMDDTTGGQPGNHWRQTLCGACLNWCKNKKRWPSEIGTGQSCTYQGFDEWDN